MHTVRILNRWFERNCQFVHQARAGAIVRAVEGLLRGGTLTLTHVGRSLSGKAKTKHKIKCIDRLLGNAHLHRERQSIYAAKARCLLVGVERAKTLCDLFCSDPVFGGTGDENCCVQHQRRQRASVQVTSNFNLLYYDRYMHAIMLFLSKYLCVAIVFKRHNNSKPRKSIIVLMLFMESV